MTRADFRRRLHIVSGIIGAIALIFIAKLYFVQVVHGDEARVTASKQYVRTTASLFDRGSIFFTRKDGVTLSAATLATGFTVVINPTKIVSPTKVYNLLSQYTDVPKDRFFKSAAKKDDPYEVIVPRVSDEVGRKIERADIPGVIVEQQRWRYYPGSNLAAQTIGFLAYDKNDLEGRYGLERYYNDVLSRKSSTFSVNFFAEVFANLGNIIFERKKVEEGSIVTTIEPNVETELVKQLKGVADEFSSKSVGGIIINPKTGAIYAMASYPDFDLNTFNTADPAYFKNPLVENVYEFGSVFKPITITAGLDSDAITATTTYTDTGRIQVDGATVSNYDGRARGKNVPIQQILSQSLNLGVAFVVEKMGTKTFASYLKKLRIGEKTGIDLPNEARGLVSNLNSPRTLEYVTASFGQGIALTPIEITRALSAVANGGILIRPHVVRAIKHTSGLNEPLDWSSQERVFKESSSREVSRMLTKVVDEALLGGTVALPELSVAAKTGTAQIASPNGGYYSDRYLHSFFGYFPAYDPQFLIFLYTVEPHGQRYASHTLTKPFIRLVSFLSNYYDVVPDRI